MAYQVVAEMRIVGPRSPRNRRRLPRDIQQ
jgi:hypothetical protein